MEEKKRHKVTEEKMELKHEPIPKYRKIFHITVAISILYLALILLMTAGGY
jgi:hypothetical protein